MKWLRETVTDLLNPAAEKQGRPADGDGSAVPGDRSGDGGEATRMIGGERLNVSPEEVRQVLRVVRLSERTGSAARIARETGLRRSEVRRVLRDVRRAQRLEGRLQTVGG